jgi:antitoxin component YwqK of YwqJK toxin-antitoxin module
MKATFTQLSILLLAIAPKFIYSQVNDWSEQNWKKYARAHSVAAESNHMAIELALDNEYDFVVDSLARIEIFQPITYKGANLRTVMKGPILEGTQKYFFPSGKICAELYYENNQIITEKYYYPSGQVYRQSIYLNNKKTDREVTFFPTGMLFSSQIWQDGNLFSDTTYFNDGRIFMIIKKLQKNITKVLKDNYYNLEKHNIETLDTKMEIDWDMQFFDQKGHKITEKQAERLNNNPTNSPSFEISKALSLRKNNSSLSDSLIINYQLSKDKLNKRVFYAHFKQDSSLHNSCTERICEDGNYFSSYPNSNFIDTLFCHQTGAILRCSETLKGRLNGKIRYYYHSGKPLAEYCFVEDFLHGSFKEYYESGNIMREGNFISGIAADTTFEYARDGKLTKMSINLDDLERITTFFWDDGLAIQRIEKVKPLKYTVKFDIYSDEYLIRGDMLKEVKKNQPRSTNYYDKKGNEISLKSFKKKYPGILPNPKIVWF